MTTDTHHETHQPHVDLAVAGLTKAVARRSRAAHDAAIGQLVALGFDDHDIASLETRIDQLLVDCRLRRWAVLEDNEQSRTQSRIPSSVV